MIRKHKAGDMMAPDPNTILIDGCDASLGYALSDDGAELVMLVDYQGHRNGTAETVELHVVFSERGILAMQDTFNTAVADLEAVKRGDRDVLDDRG